jgi:hypothetical protein
MPQVLITFGVVYEINIHNTVTDHNPSCSGKYARYLLNPARCLRGQETPFFTSRMGEFLSFTKSHSSAFTPFVVLDRTANMFCGYRDRAWLFAGRLLSEIIRHHKHRLTAATQISRPGFRLATRIAPYSTYRAHDLAPCVST